MSVIKPAVIEGDGDLELSIHDHIISQPLAEVGIRNSGKSYQAGKICEELCEAKQPFIVIDPEGEYWTLRQRYPVIIAAVGKPVGRPKGYKADLIVTEETALVLARRVAERGYSLVLDLRNATMAESYEVLGKFLEALYEAEAEYNRPLVVIMEEAHVLVPEVGRVRLPGIKKAQDRVIYWTYEIAARGRHRGLGYICIARRAAEVAKAILSQCPNRIIFKLVDPTDLAWLRESGLSKEEIEVVKRLPQGKALVIGLREKHFYIRSKPRLCSHGGKTPIAKAVETPELESAVEDLTKMIKAPRVQSPPPSEEFEKLQGELEARREQVKKLEGMVSGLKREVLSLQAEREELKIKIKDLESKVMTSEERLKYESRIKTLESEVNSLKEQLGEAAELETQLERVRELLGSWKDLMLETCNTLDIELIPGDVQAVIQERDELRKKLEVYEREEKLKEELIEDTLKDPGVKSWISDARGILRDLSRQGQAGGAILKAVVR
ncbi:MAG: helicase HerA domain-containing protein, partial [Candidatus Nezhaarchaeales archaeon]